MTEFFRYPHTPHLAWLGPGRPREDKVLTAAEADVLLAGEVVVEEKVDGANIGISTTSDGVVRVQNRGGFMDSGSSHAQFGPLWPWLLGRKVALANALDPRLVLFGEWCYLVHSIAYSRLPSWFLGFDVYDRTAKKFWDTSRRDSLLKELRFHSVPFRARGHLSMEQIERLTSGASCLGDGPMEGVVVRQESGGWSSARAKLVRPEFSQGIEEHWARLPMRRQRLVDEIPPLP